MAGCAHLLRERVFAPLGLREGEDYTIGYGKTFEVDGLPLVANWGGGSFTARAVARIGQLLVQGGAWEGRQLIAADIVHQVTAHGGMPAPEAQRAAGDPAPVSGLGFWVNADGVWPHPP